MLDEEYVLEAAAVFTVVSGRRKWKRPRRFWYRPAHQSGGKCKANNVREDLVLGDTDPLKLEYRLYVICTVNFS